ncbi:MAG: protoheme IX farnesyltransferase [Planctomycetes bacterium]|nr:protoheme IX farnesyltransferase [Planctomycetota bacterium]
MRSATSVATCETTTAPLIVAARTQLASRVADYLQIVKPRISVMVLITVAAGFGLASGEGWQLAKLLHAMLGIALVATASSAFNQALERESDGFMRRTKNRPLPSGRLSTTEVVLFGLGTGVCGAIWLAAFVNPVTSMLTALTLALYVGAYTPLKRRTSFGVVIGAIPGAMPPVLGWTAAGAPLDLSAFSLFAILFLWQFPHFLAIAWIYRDEYARAGLKMLPAGGTARYLTGILAVGYALALVPLSLCPAATGMAGNVYLFVALVLSVAYLVAASRFALQESLRSARVLLWTSLLYLPALLVVLVWDHFRLLS